ncbi:carbamoyltransferase HypF [Shewanella maritima]|uniref:carbamoyltransferase HypF n=1 Tax=Shewanella maritima TaxID=2520507 RepID=UPI0037364DC2
MAQEQVSIFVKGIVQGVGFRPFVYRLADTYSLTGTVLNDHLGVSIVLQGEATSINHFLTELEQHPPVLARIDAINTEYQTINNIYDDFSIIESDKGDAQAIVALSADKSTCQDCLDEMADSQNRHYHYPFTNCTNCGPRYSIINALPYDRHNTSMANFVMCKQCEQAYTNPLDRRYHAQPVSCPDCGPKLRILERQAQSDTFAPFAETSFHSLLQQIVSLLEQGKVLAIKGLGGFHLVCDATNHHAVTTLRQRKQRAAKPLAVMVKDLSQAKLLAQGSQAEWQLLQSAEKPIVVLNKHSVLDSPSLATETHWKLSDAIAPDIDRIGLFLPYTPLHHLLLQQFGKPLVATSANRSGEPIICDCDDIMSELGHVVDAIVDHNRPIINACDDSVVQMINDQLQVIRLARGYAPLTLASGNLALDENAYLGVGGQQKNAVAFGFKGNMILSPHIGDLFNLPAQHYFERSLATFKRLYDFTPSHIVTDQHPDYAPSRWANDYCEQNIQVHQSTIQHHYAHILAIMAANQHTKPVLGFSFDGTGLGNNKSLWGSEVMLADCQQYQTVAHFSAFKLIGGEQAIKYPVRILLALLFEHFDLDTIRSLPIPAINNLSDTQLGNLHTLWLNPNHGITCRSVGRLFDALAVALGLIESNQFEGQAGMLIEAQASQATSINPSTDTHIDANAVNISLTVTAQQYPAMTQPEEPAEFAVKTVTQWDSQDLFKQIIHHIQTAPNSPAHYQQICHGFISALAGAVHGVSQQYAHYPHVFCGGVFQNKVLLQQCLNQANSHGIYVLASQQVPVSDGGIALGQLWATMHRNELSQAGLAATID